MPRKDDPSVIQTGSGVTPPSNPNQSLSGISSHPLVGNNTTITPEDLSSGVHTSNPKSHTANQVQITDPSDHFFSNSVAGALDELASMKPPSSPAIGTFKSYVGVTGIPDWGILKLGDASLISREAGSFTHTSNNADVVFPYYYHPAHPAQTNPPFEPSGLVLQTQGGNDPVPDPTFNLYDATYLGGGPGKSVASGFARNDSGPVRQTLRAIDWKGGGHQVVVSGVVSPADRGVLALFHYPPDGDLASFLGQPLTERVIAAILLGNGCGGGSCDGTPGGIFTVGDSQDPFAFPGQATGQFDLSEIHTGVYGTHVGVPLAGTPLPAPWNDLDGDATPGHPRAGQVRLGTDVNAGITPVVNGIPILGATTAAQGSVGNDNNFFRYRLPYLDDYNSAGNGIKYTPTNQHPRYYKKPAISLTPGTDLTQAGNFANFPKDFWNYQVARFRHAFSLDTNAVSPRESGTFVLVHFKYEHDFEKMARDGIPPTDDKVFGSNLLDWNDPESTTHMTSGAGTDTASTSYHVIRSNVFEDDTGKSATSLSTGTYDYSKILDSVTWVSGVAYFIPRNLGDGSAAWKIADLTATASNFWTSTFRTFDDTTASLNMPNPCFLHLAPFAYSIENPNYIGFPGALITNPGQVRQQRVEFQFQDLGSYTLNTAPTSGDTLSVLVNNPNEVTFEGDNSQPSFSEDARVRMFFRRPLAHQSVSESETAATGIALTPLDSKTVMFHSTDYPFNANPTYGNFLSAGKAVASLETSLKDVREAFLDEVYRYLILWPDVDTYITLATQQNLLGPGLPNAAGNIDVPVRPGTSGSNGWLHSSYLQSLSHEQALGAGGLTDEAQVAGLPERNPPLSEGTLFPFPSSGILRYPQIDYNTNYRPSSIDGDISAAQPDYSTTVGTKYYVRAFDADFSRSTSASADGTTQLIFRVYGIQFADFAYASPGPGSAKLAIQVKVPGQTTWMDAGRAEGDGPGKTDPAFDGAGCFVAGANTFDGVDATTGLVYAQVEVNTGANMFLNTASEVPVLFKIALKDHVDTKTKYNFTYDFNSSSASPTAKTGDVRGIVTLELIRPPT